MPQTLKTKKKTDRARISVQVAPDLRAAIEHAAAADNRSLSSWIVNALAGAVSTKKGGR